MNSLIHFHMVAGCGILPFSHWADLWNCKTRPSFKHPSPARTSSAQSNGRSPSSLYPVNQHARPNLHAVNRPMTSGVECFVRGGGRGGSWNMEPSQEPLQITKQVAAEDPVMEPEPPAAACPSTRVYLSKTWLELIEPILFIFGKLIRGFSGSGDVDGSFADGFIVTSHAETLVCSIHTSLLILLSAYLLTLLFIQPCIGRF